jgi:hypothetical protein
MRLKDRLRFAVYATDEQGGGSPADEATTDQVDTDGAAQADDSEEWVNPAEELRRNLGAQQQAPQIDPDEIARTVAAKLGYTDDDGEDETERFKREVAAEVLRQIQGPMGEVIKPSLVNQLSDQVCKGLGQEARGKLAERLGKMTAQQLSAMSTSPEALDDLRTMAEGFHSRARKQAQAPRSEGAGSQSRAVGDTQNDPHFEEWYARIGSRTLGLNRDEARKTFKELQKA